MVPVSEGSDRVITCGKIKPSSLFRSSRKGSLLGQDAQTVVIGGDTKQGTPRPSLGTQARVERISRVLARVWVDSC